MQEFTDICENPSDEQFKNWHYKYTPWCSQDVINSYLEIYRD